MKTVASFIKAFFVLLIPVGVCQCTGNYNLVDYKEYHHGKLDDHISYNYNGAGELKSKTRFRFGHQNTLTLYDVKIYDNGIDTIETTYEIYVRDSTDYDQIAYKEVTSYTLDGIKRSSTTYGIKDSQWVKSSHQLYDTNGRLSVNNYNDVYFNYYTYDSLGRRIVSRSISYGDWYEDGYHSTMDTVIFSDDGRLATRTENTWNNKDSIWEVNHKYLYEIDQNGRITALIYSSTQKSTYQYDRKGRLKRETEYSQYDSLSTPQKRTETINIYLFGLKIRSIKIIFEHERKGVDYYIVYKYDFRHKLMLEEKMYDDIFDKRLLSRKIWTYEKTK